MPSVGSEMLARLFCHSVLCLNPSDKHVTSAWKAFAKLNVMANFVINPHHLWHHFGSGQALVSDPCLFILPAVGHSFYCLATVRNHHTFCSSKKSPVFLYFLKLEVLRLWHWQVWPSEACRLLFLLAHERLVLCLAVFGIPWLEDASSSALLSVNHVCPHLSLPVTRRPVPLA